MLALGACLGAPPSGSTITQVVAVEPMIGPGIATPSLEAFRTGYGLTKQAIESFWHLYLHDAFPSELSGIPGMASDDMLAGLPPVAILTSEYDPLRDEAEEFVARLRRIDKAVEHRRFDGLIHGSIYYSGRVAAAVAVFDALVQRIEESWRP
jgi:acetyl esterase